MIPPERALVCTHPTLGEMPALTFYDLQHPGIGCPTCHARIAIPIPLHRFAGPTLVSPEYRYLVYQRRMNDYISACIGLTFGERWARHIKWTRLLHQMMTRERGS